MVTTHAVNLPSFLEESAILWVILAEPIFHVGRILTQDLKFQTIVTRLPVLVQVMDIVSEAAYNRLKTACSLHPEPRKKDPTTPRGTQLGDQRSSQLLRQMQALAGHHYLGSDAPNHLVSRLAHARAGDPSLSGPVGHKADKIMEIASTTVLLTSSTTMK